MRDDATPTTTPRLVFGLLIVAVGLLFTLDNLGLAEVDDLLRYWPVIFIVLGIARLWSGVQRAKGVLWIVLGGVLMLPVVSDEVEYQDLIERWPLFLIGLGVYFVWRSFAARTGPPDRGTPDRGTPDHRPPDLSDRPGVTPPPVPPPPPSEVPGAGGCHEPPANASVSAFSFLSSVKKTFDGPGFRRGEATALLGGTELDLRGAELAAEGATIEVLAFWGGVTLRIPHDWPVELEANVLMGASEDNTRPPDGKERGEMQVGVVLRIGNETGRESPGPRLAVRGFVLMGGVEVRN